MANLTDDELVARALEAKTHAYAPYSKFHVGAALVANGKLYTGANVENASYGLTICAERTAVAAAAFAGARTLETIAVASDIAPPAAPCGMCLQTLAEFAPNPTRLRVILANATGARRIFTLSELLPHGFGPRDLDRP